MSKIIRFDRGDFIFNPEDFKLTAPSEFSKVYYKPITSRILYKNGICLIRFPIQYGYGLSVSANETNDDKYYSFTYVKRDQTDEEKKFLKFIEEFEIWSKKEVAKIAKEQAALRAAQQPAVLTKKLTEDLSKNDSLIKPFFCYPKNPDTKEPDPTKLLRHYIKFKVDDKGKPDCTVLNLENVSKKLKVTDIVNTETTKKPGEYVMLVKIKGFFYRVGEPYEAFLQTTGDTVCYRRSQPHDPFDIMGEDYKPSEEDVVEKEKGDDEDEIFERNMMKKGVTE
jgi:hypothetical protein